MALYTQKDRVRLLRNLALFLFVYLCFTALFYPALGSTRRDPILPKETIVLWVFWQSSLCIVILFVWIAAVRNWHPPGTCRKCGYDLRGSWAAGKESCPECGHEFYRDACEPVRPLPSWLRITYSLLIVIPVIMGLVLTLMAFAPVPYEPLADPKYTIYLHNWPQRFRRMLEYQMMLRYLIINLAICLTSLVVCSQHASRKPHFVALLSPICSLIFFCLFSYLLLPALR